MNQKSAPGQQSEISVKEQLIAFVTNAHAIHNSNKAKAIEVIRLDSSCNFGIQVYENAQKSESLVSAINLSLDYINSSEFKAISEEEIKDILAKKAVELIDLEIRHVLDGFSNLEMILLTGFSRYRAFINSALKYDAGL